MSLSKLAAERGLEQVIATVARGRSNALDQDHKVGALAAAERAEKRLDDPDLLVNYDIDLARQTVLGELGYANIEQMTDATKLGNNVVTARAMAVHDAAAINLWVQDAAIESAKIKDLIANKIAAGDVQVKLNITVGGGIDLGINSEGAVPTNIVDKYLGTNYAKQWVYDSASRRGWQARADGVAGGKNGRLTYIATRYSGATPTDITDYAALLVSSEAVHLGYAGVSVRHALSVVGPARIGSALEVGGSLDVSFNAYLNGVITRNVDTHPLQFGRGVDITQGDLRFTDAAVQAIRSTGGVPLDLWAPTSSIRAQNAMRCESGLIVVGGVNLDNGVIKKDYLASESVGEAKLHSSIRNGSWTTYSARTIGALLGGTVNNVASGNHSHGSGNSLDFDYLPTAHKERVFSSRTQARDYRRRIAAGETLSQDEMLDALWHALYLGATGVMVEIDAPDLSAEERHDMRLRGDVFGEFFEYRRQEQIDSEVQRLIRSASMGKGSMAAADTHAESQHLHAPHLRWYATEHPDAT